ncbi:MAG TPA: family 1 glycosylhydrolase, partial [Candidatus Saccharimonadia bacterium]|nr:family 1 glycosylhydrolase [Candidatus Saccharimonadia bacterium]
MRNQFPKDFFWGASTASHQVEGGNHNQWTVWEKNNAKELALSAERRLSYLSDWNDIKTQATNPENYISGKGIDHYNRFREDFDLAKGLNLNSLRFSIEWSRIEPEPGKWDEREIDHYLQYIQEMKKRGLEPFLNIWHWTCPIWFDHMGGFEKKKNLVYFDRFTKKIAETLLTDINYILVLNEPLVYLTHGYVTGEWTPNKKNYWKFMKVNYNLLRSHKIAYKNFKSVKPTVNIGV